MFDVFLLQIERDIEYFAKTNAGVTPLHLSCRYSDLTMASIFLEKTRQVNYLSSGQSPLYFLVKLCQIKIASFFFLNLILISAL
jgi:ankyrin repeat protein